MHVHDWTRVQPGIFHDFHCAWIIELRNVLNGGLLPGDFYALAEQHSGRIVPDLLTLHADVPSNDLPPLPPSTGGVALAEAPPKVSRRLTGAETCRQLRRTLAIRHVSGHRLVAILEIISPANKDRTESVEQFVSKALAAFDSGVHLLMVDLFPPGLHDPHGMQGAIWENFAEEPYVCPAGDSMTVASFMAGPPVQAFINHFRIGQPIPEAALFLLSERYIPVPMDSTYLAAYRGVPAFYRNILEAR